MTHAELVELLWCMRACDSAREWVVSHPAEPQDLWLRCKRPEWMIWLATTAGVEQTHILGALRDVLGLVEPLMPKAHIVQQGLEYFKDWSSGRPVERELLSSIQVTLLSDWRTREATSPLRYALSYLGGASKYCACVVVEDAHTLLQDHNNTEQVVALIRSNISWETMEHGLRHWTPGAA
jgi:hypothetical protein